ncbi:MAG: tyrosine-type recombinase/integrase [Candidatus Methanomethylicia archaeon]|nr:tyrosine-type recombinase/integrase [Candidatus Methanomethylicia archaeon]
MVERTPAWSEVEEFLEKVRSLFRKKEISLRDFLILSMYPTSGLKTSELLKLRKRDLDLQNGVISINRNGKAMQVVVMPWLLPHLKDYVKGKGDDEKVFRISRRQALNINYSYTEQILGSKLRIEDWRKAYSLRIVETIKDPSLCKKILGLKTQKTINAYVKAISRDAKDEIIKAIGG